MDNLKLPAYPLPIARHNNGTLNTTLDVDSASVGFTKLELAALMIAQGHVNNFEMGNGVSGKEFLTAFSAKCVAIAKAVLELANK